MNTLSETAFYDFVAQFFDVMTDWRSRLAAELPWLIGVFGEHQVHTVLDSAAGTGQHGIALAQRGYNVTGADASTRMVERARGNARLTATFVEFHVIRFSDLDLLNRKYDSVLCLGNSFPHVLEVDEAIASLKSMRNCLRKGGLLVMQNLNYDKRWLDKPRWFGVNAGILNGRETLVWRFADYGERLITFNIAVFSREPAGAWSVQVQSTLQRPYQSSDLEALLVTAGFSSIERYGGLDGSHYSANESPDLVIVASA